MIEENPPALATIKDGKPYMIAVAYVKVKGNKIIITNNYMRTSIENIKNNAEVSLAVWDKNWHGYQINGKAEYFTNEKWLNFIKKIGENKNEPCKGAIIVKINHIKKLA